MKRLLLAVFFALTVGTYAPQFSVPALAVECPYLAPVSFTVLPRGDSPSTFTLSFAGFGPGPVRVVVKNSSGAVIADVPGLSPSGSYVLTLPSTPGVYTLHVTGDNECEDQRESEGPVVVPGDSLSQPPIGDAGLPTTGNDAHTPLKVGAVLVLSGLGLVGIAWRRRRVVRAASAAL